MAEVLLGLGSNQRRYYHLQAGVDALRKSFADVSLSPVYESAAVGFDGPAFLNMVARIQCDVTITELFKSLRAIEESHGRQRGEASCVDKTLDIDILTYDQCVGQFGSVVLPRGEILLNAFVLAPLADLVPDSMHPSTGKTFEQHWREYSYHQCLRKVDFRWR